MNDWVSQPFSPRHLSAAAVLRAYRESFFPMACGDGKLRWFSPDPRGVLPLENFKIPHGFRRMRSKLDFTVTCDAAFGEVVVGCADRAETWIDASIARVYGELHAKGLAHSVEVWSEDDLIGGLYGVRIGGAFFGESMFSRIEEASKLALVSLVKILRDRGFRLLDIQWVTAHLQMFGAVKVSRAHYLHLLREALNVECVFGAPVGKPEQSLRIPELRRIA